MFKRLVQNGKEILEKESSSILSAATIIMGATLISAVLGVVRTRLLISHFYVDKGMVDVFWAAFRLPDMIFQIVVVGALSSAFIPVFSRHIGNRDEANRLASSAITVVMGVMMALSILIMILAEPLSRVIAGGFTESQIEIMVNLTRIMAGAQLFFGFSSFLTGIIQSRKRFLIPALSPVLYNVGIIIGIVGLGRMFGIYGPAIGVIIGALLHLIAQIPLARSLGFQYRPTLRVESGVREMGGLMLPRTLTLSLAQIESTVIIAFSSWLGLGMVTIVSIAQQLAGLPVRLVGIPIAQASLPFFARTGDSLQNLARIVTSTILEMLYLALPASAIILVLRIPFVRLAYGADSFPWGETVMTGKLVAILAVSIAARSLTHIIVRVFYALHDTKTPFFIGLISTIINVGLSYYLLFIIGSGVMGMAVAITIAALVETAALASALYKRANLSRREIVGPLSKIVFATIVMGFSLWGPLRLLDQLIFDTTRTIPLIMLTITVSIIGLVVYVGLSYMLQIKELAVFARIGEKLGNWQKYLGLSGEPIESQESSV